MLSLFLSLFPFVCVASLFEDKEPFFPSWNSSILTFGTLYFPISSLSQYSFFFSVHISASHILSSDLYFLHAHPLCPIIYSHCFWPYHSAVDSYILTVNLYFQYLSHTSGRTSCNYFLKTCPFLPFDLFR